MPVSACAVQLRLQTVHSTLTDPVTSIRLARPSCAAHAVLPELPVPSFCASSIRHPSSHLRHVSSDNTHTATHCMPSPIDTTGSDFTLIPTSAATAAATAFAAATAAAATTTAAAATTAAVVGWRWAQECPRRLKR